MVRQSFRLVVVGGEGSGKTAFLAAMFGSLRLADGSRRYWLEPADLESLERLRSLGLQSHQGYPGQTREILAHVPLTCKVLVGSGGRGGFHFSNLLRPGTSANRQGALLDVVISDYPGSWLEASAVPRRDLWAVLSAADALVVAVDGAAVLALMRGEPQGRTYVEQDLPRILDLVGPSRGTRGIPLHLALTKWDLLDEAGFGLARVRDRLFAEVEGLRHLVEVAPLRHTRLIPVSTAGYFQHTAVRRAGPQPYERPLSMSETVNLDVPLSLALPVFADEALTEVRRHRRWRVLSLLSWAALALLSALGHVVSSLMLVGRAIGKRIDVDPSDIAKDAATVSRGALRFADGSRRAAREEHRGLIRYAAQMHEAVKDSCATALRLFDREFESSDLDVRLSGYPLGHFAEEGVRRRSAPTSDLGSRARHPGDRADHRFEEAADRLALWVRSVAESEVHTRGLDFPAPLSFRWQHIDEHALRPHGEVKCHPSRLVEAYEDLRTNTLVVAAPPGAGKTVLSLLLVRALSQLRLESGAGPVPISVPVSSWDRRLDLRSWILEQVSSSHPWLATLHRELLGSGRLLVVLDGVDELPAGWTEALLRQIADLPADIPLVITARTTQYASTSALLGAGARGRFADAAVIELLPASVDEVVRYVQESSPAEVRGEWSPLESVLSDPRNEALREALTTPLTAWLFARLYAGHPAEFIRSLGDTPDVRRIRADLLQRFLTRGPRRDTVDPRTSRLLRSLARLMREMHQDPDDLAQVAQDFAWWRVADAPSARRFAAVAAGLFGGAATAAAVGIGAAITLWGRISTGSALAACTVLAVLTGGYVGYRCGRNSPAPTSLQFKIPRRLRAPVRAAAVIAVVGAAAGYAVSETGRGMAAGLLMAVPVALVYAFLTTEVDSRLVASPRAFYRSDFTQSVTFSLAYAVSIGATGWWFRGPLLGVLLGIAAGITGGMTYGIVFELAFVDKKAGRSAPSGLVAWLRFRFAAAWLAARGRLPWRVFRFLDEMHQAGLLRQVGPVYQFRHLMMLEELAEDRDGASGGGA